MPGGREPFGRNAVSGSGILWNISGRIERKRTAKPGASKRTAVWIGIIQAGYKRNKNKKDRGSAGQTDTGGALRRTAGTDNRKTGNPGGSKRFQRGAEGFFQKGKAECGAKKDLLLFCAGGRHGASDLPGFDEDLEEACGK